MLPFKLLVEMGARRNAAERVVLAAIGTRLNLLCFDLIFSVFSCPSMGLAKTNTEALDLYYRFLLTPLGR